MKPYIYIAASACLCLSLGACQPRQEGAQETGQVAQEVAGAPAENEGASVAQVPEVRADTAPQPEQPAPQVAPAGNPDDELDALLEAQRPRFKPIVIYFSHTGNTRYIAEYIQKATDADILEIKPLDPYPEDPDAVLERARKELDTKAFPAIADPPQEIQELKPPKLRMYSVVYLGFPNWYGTIPRPVMTLIASGLLYAKAVAPFVTHGGGGMQNIETDLKEALESSKVLKGLLVRDKNARNSQKEIDRWLMTISTSRR
ncbi:MAG: hypothetical protein II180_14890 [Proteobacteria bacterium]|nr:hypothetical protein [Pseudomonadota bacterium]